MQSAAAPQPAATAPRGSRRGGLRRALAAAAVAVALGATFALYLRPDLTLDLGQLMAFCGVR